MFRRSL